MSLELGDYHGMNIFYKELPEKEENIFIANITEKNKVENVKFKKSFGYAVTGLSINQENDSNLVAVIDTNRQNVLSNLTRKLVKEKKKNLALILKYIMKKGHLIK